MHISSQYSQSKYKMAAEIAYSQLSRNSNFGFNFKFLILKGNLHDICHEAMQWNEVELCICHTAILKKLQMANPVCCYLLFVIVCSFLPFY